MLEGINEITIILDSNLKTIHNQAKLPTLIDLLFSSSMRKPAVPALAFSAELLPFSTSLSLTTDVPCWRERELTVLLNEGIPKQEN